MRTSSALFCAAFRQQMAGAAERLALSAWHADDRRWYLDLVAQADDDFSSMPAAAVSTTLENYNALPWDQCILLVGDGERRVTDTVGSLWSDDRYGRWLETRTKPLVWLHVQIGNLIHGRQLCADGHVWSHVCGHCHCIRLEHIVSQSVRADRLDRAHHSEYGAGSIRPEHVPTHLVISSPVSVIGANPA